MMTLKDALKGEVKSIELIDPETGERTEIVPEFKPVIIADSVAQEFKDINYESRMTWLSPTDVSFTGEITMPKVAMQGILRLLGIDKGHSAKFTFKTLRHDCAKRNGRR